MIDDGAPSAWQATRKTRHKKKNNHFLASCTVSIATAAKGLLSLAVQNMECMQYGKAGVR